MPTLKEQLYAACFAYIQQRIDTAQYGIDEARASSAGETKSSAGDKYETGRAMAQQEIDRNTALLAEAKQLLTALQKLNTSVKASSAIAGSIVYTDKAAFYISISAGLLNIGNKKYFAISPASPIGIKLSGKRAGEKFDMNGAFYTINAIE